MVEIFATDITTAEIADQIFEHLQRRWPESRIVFDLDDCDKILKIENGQIDTDEIIFLLAKYGCHCRILK